MWEFMKNYADGFWNYSEHTWEVFVVLMAWAITLGIMVGIIKILTAIGEGIAEEIKYYKWLRKKEEITDDGL